MSKPTIAIVGKPNVGKSTIFNKLAGERLSIEEDTPGVTRDRIYSSASWLSYDFHVIDTGGILLENVPLSVQIRQQAELAIDEADVIVFMVDGRDGLTHADEEVAAILYQSHKPIVLAVNKVDNLQMQENAFEFYALGLGTPYPISGSHGLGLGDMLDAVVDCFPEHTGMAYDDTTIQFCLIGRPNVGKSSIVNALLGEERVIVSEMPGTTREAVDSPFSKDDQSYVIVDTAGIRKRGKVYERTEKYSVLRARSAIERSEVAVLVIDGEQGVIEQDKKIAGYAHEAGRAVIIVINKWDVVEKDNKTMKEFTDNVRTALPFLDYAPMLFVSAKTHQRLHKLFPLLTQVADNHNLRVKTSTLNDVVLDAIAMNPTPSRKGKRLKIFYMTQVGTGPPAFIVFVNNTELMHFSYIRFLKNQLRQSFGFVGTPIHVMVRQKAEGDE